MPDRDPGNSPPDQELVDDAVMAWLAEALDQHPIEMCRLPDSLPAEAGWAILYPQGGGVFAASLDEAAANVAYGYQVTCCGRTAAQARRVSKRVLRRVLDRDGDAAFITPLDLAAAGLRDTDRGLQAGYGSLDYVEGIFQVVEQFYVAVTPAGGPP
jgi:hypothetical protein